MSENFYVVTATVMPVLLLSSTFLAIKGRVVVESRFDLWFRRISLFAVALGCAAVAIAFSFVMSALRTGEPMADWAQTLTSSMVTVLFAANVGALCGPIVFQALSIRVSRDHGSDSGI